jgi:hypothetical protein
MTRDLQLVQVSQRPVEVAIQVTHFQEGLHPGQQFRLLKRLGEEIVTPGSHGALFIGDLVQ